MLSKNSMVRLVCAALLLVVATRSDRASAGACYADWSEAAPIVLKEKLTTVEALAVLAKARIPGAIVKTTLCEESEGFVYRLLIRDSSGRLSNRTVDARAPFAR
jgi:hypothetical protein